MARELRARRWCPASGALHHEIKYALDALVATPLGKVLGEVWQLQERRVAVPEGLRDHLAQLHARQGGFQPAAARDDVHHGQQEPRGFGQDVGEVFDELGRRRLAP